MARHGVDLAAAQLDPEVLRALEGTMQGVTSSKRDRSLRWSVVEAAVQHSRGTNLRKIQARSSCMIDPRKSRAVDLWAGVTIASLIFVALVTPFEVGFLDAPSCACDPLFILNRVIDVIFILDCMLQFLLMVPIDYGTQGTHWIHDPWLVAKHYLKGWFSIDAMSIGISSLDFVGLGDNKTSIEELRMLRVLRALRLIKLAKLLTGVKLIKKYEVKVAINYGAVSLLKCMIGMLLLSHWFACIWAMQAGFADSPLDTWLGGNGDYCVADPNNNVTGVSCRGPEVRYVAAVYWAVMTITSIGYGDIAATPGNTPEQFVATMLMILGAMGWGMVLGTIVSNLSNLDPEGDEFTSTMGELNRMMSLEGLPDNMRVRLREYFQETLHIRRTQKRAELLALMSPSLQSEVAWQVSKSWLTRISFLSGATLPFMVQLALQLKPQVFAPAEEAPIGGMYIVSRGLALYGARVYGQGKVWGEDMILTTEHLKLRYNARAMNYLDTLTVTREELEGVAESFTSARKQLRHFVVRLAFRRAIIYESYKRRQAAGEDLGDTGMPFLEKLDEDQPVVRPRRQSLAFIGGPDQGFAIDAFKCAPHPLPGVASQSLPVHLTPQLSSGTRLSSTHSASLQGKADTNQSKLPTPIQRAFEAFLSPSQSISEVTAQHPRAEANVALASSAAATEAHLTPMLEALMIGQKELIAGQRRMEKDIAKQQEMAHTLKKQLHEVEKWVMADALRKLRA